LSDERKRALRERQPLSHEEPERKHMEQVRENRSMLELPIWLWLWLPLALLAGVAASHFLGRDVYTKVVFSEWGIVENVTVLFLIVAVVGGVRLLVARQLPDRLLDLWIAMLTLGCFYFAGEEASWGQHLFGWTTPDGWAAVNDQQETNIHNMMGTGLFDQVPRTALAIIALVGGVVIPILRRRQASNNATFWNLHPLFWATLVCTPSALLAVTVSVPGKVLGKLGADVPHLLRVFPGEVKELYLAMFLMLYLLSLTKRLQTHSAGTISIATPAKPQAHQPEYRRRVA
jgi:hypothetical protein